MQAIEIDPRAIVEDPKAHVREFQGLCECYFCAMHALYPAEFLIRNDHKSSELEPYIMGNKLDHSLSRYFKLILLQYLLEGESPETAANGLFSKEGEKIDPRTVAEWRENYRQGGLLGYFNKVPNQFGKFLSLEGVPQLERKEHRIG